LWDYNEADVNSVSKLIWKLRHRFGSTSQLEKYQMEAKCRCRKPSESLQHLHSDLCCLTALAFPKLEDKARKMMACDYFVDALNDPMLELKIREKAPQCLDAAYKEALNLEMWQQSIKE